MTTTQLQQIEKAIPGVTAIYHGELFYQACDGPLVDKTAISSQLAALAEAYPRAKAYLRAYYQAVAATRYGFLVEDDDPEKLRAEEAMSHLMAGGDAEQAEHIRTTKMTYTITNTSELTATDLLAELALAKDGDYEIAQVEIDGKAERAQALFIPSIGRGGISWGADADWSDCDSIADLVERYLGIDDKEMVN
jgi:hypothetical protein